jgi:hypothetical protein
MALPSVGSSLPSARLSVPSPSVLWIRQSCLSFGWTAWTVSTLSASNLSAVGVLRVKNILSAATRLQKPFSNHSSLYTSLFKHYAARFEQAARLPGKAFVITIQSALGNGADSAYRIEHKPFTNHSPRIASIGRCAALGSHRTDRIDGALRSG